MKSPTLVSALIALLALGACGPIYETVYDYAPPASAEGRMCAAQCASLGGLCRQNCDLREQRCLADARARGARDYEYYVRGQESKKAPIKLSVSDFTNEGECYNSSRCKSECTLSYNQCFSACGGSVTSRQICTAFCK
jgi:hypothetical protein